MLALYDPLVPNHAYAAPNKFYEALALGKPLVMFRNTGMANVIEENDIGVICEPTEQGLEDAFKTLINRNEEWLDMGERMQTLFREHYSWNIMDKRLKGLYLDMMKNRR